MIFATLKRVSLAFVFSFFGIAAFGQHYFGVPPCSHDGCQGIIGLEEQHDSFIPPPADFVPYQSRDVVISVNYNGFTPDAQAAFQYAVDIWASLLTSNVPIIVEATWEDIPGNTLGFAGPTNLFQNFGGAPESNVLYPSALADKLNGSNLDPGAADIVASFDSGTNWYLGTDGNPGFGQYDFVSVVLHELGHGLGVVGTATVEGNNGFILNSNPSVYDIFVENGNNQPITGIAEGFPLYQELTSDDLFWNGAIAVGNNGGVDPKLYAPGTWAQGSSYSHVDENEYFAGSENSLMTPFIAPGEAIHDPGPIIMGLMGDIGWTVEEPAPCELNAYELVLTPDCYGNEITWEVRDESNTIIFSGGPYPDNFPENIVPISTELCLGSGCYTFTIFDSFGDGLAGSNEPDCGVDGDFFITDPLGNVVVQMGGANYGSSEVVEFCVDGDILGCTDPLADNYNPNATIDDGSCTYGGSCVPTAITLSQNCLFDEETQELINRILVEVELSGDCFVQEVCFTPTGGGAQQCFFLPDFDIFVEDGDGVFIPVPEAGTYDVFVTTTDGTSPVETISVDCSQAITGCGNPFAVNYNPLVEVNIPEDCIYDTFICDCAGTQHTNGVLVWLGDGFLDDGSFQWEGQNVDFNCSTWGYDCGDGDLTDDPFGVCDGNLPPDNGCTTGCAPLDLDVYQEPCIDTDQGLQPVIGFTFDIDGSCQVQDFCYQVDGGGFECFDLPGIDILIGDGEDLFLSPTIPGATYEFYYTTDDGTLSPTFTWVNGDCNNETIICDCAGTQHTIGVLGWLGDTFADDGSFDWNGQPVDFNCATWGFDCGDLGITNDPNGVCDGNLPPNNGCVGEIPGCTDPTAVNFDPSATINDGSCIYEVPGCDDVSACNYDPDATVNDGSCDFSCYGCTDPLAENFDPNATIDDGSCVFGQNEGCTDPNACNYDPNAEVEDGSCDYSCLGCTDDEACNYDPDATIDNGSCDYSCYGCTDPLANNYDPTATIDDGSCTYDDEGCTDPEACNYDPNATFDDGSCDYSCLGCTDDTALNYDPTATIDDGSCIYDCEDPEIEISVIGCGDGDSEFYIEVDVTDLGNGAPYEMSNSENNDEEIIDQIGSILVGPFTDGDEIDLLIQSDVLDGCFVAETGISCPINILGEELEMVSIYPNPANDQVIISTPVGAMVQIDMLDLSGKRVMTQQLNGGLNRLGVQHLAEGMYFINVITGDQLITHKLIIQH